MGKHEKRVYLEAIGKRYRRARRSDKGKILDEFCSVCGYQRKYAIRLLGSKLPRSPRRPGRPSQYNQPALLAVLRRIWLATDQMCSKRLVAAMPLWLPPYEMRFGALGGVARSKLTGISPASIDRLLKPVRMQHPKGLSGTKPGTLLKYQIPIRTTHWDITLPGFMEADTVAHCGNSLAGDFVWSLTLPIFSPGGQNAVPPGTRAPAACWNRSRRLSKRCLSNCADSIVTTAASFSITIYCVIFPSIQSSRSLPVRAPTRRTTMRMSSRKIGRMSGSFRLRASSITSSLAAPDEYIICQRMEHYRTTSTQR